MLPFVIITLTLLIFTPVRSSADFNVYNYDLTTPMFSPDGRLMQVEYASLAQRGSSPLILIPCLEGVVMASAIPSSNDSPSSTNHPHNQRRGQGRIVELPTAVPNVSLVLGLSGILSDNMALVKEARQHLESWTRSYGGLQHFHPLANDKVSGIAAVTMASRVARVIGDACQMHSFGGGIRPYGASIVVCGVDNDGVSVFTTNPAGSVIRSAVVGPLIVGGASAAQKRMQIRMKSVLNVEVTGKKTSVRTAVEAAMTVLLEESNRFELSQGDDDHVEISENRKNQGHLLDVVIVTPMGGVHQLNEKQVNDLIISLDLK